MVSICLINHILDFLLTDVLSQLADDAGQLSDPNQTSGVWVEEIEDLPQLFVRVSRLLQTGGGSAPTEVASEVDRATYRKWLLRLRHEGYAHIRIQSPNAPSCRS